MLRESVELSGGSIDFDGLTDPSRPHVKGVPYSEELLQFADTCLGKDQSAFTGARRALIEKMGPEAMVDTAGIVSNFQRMVRIADAIGIPTDEAMLVTSEKLRGQLGINDYVSAANSNQPSHLKKLLLKVVAVPRFLKMIRKASTNV